MDKLKYIKLENEDGSYSNLIPLAVDGQYVDINGVNLPAKLNTLATKTEVQAVASGSPAGVYTTVSALTTADPDHNKIYLVTDNGHWYYYNESWQDGGLYQSELIAENSIGNGQLNEEVYDYITDSNFKLNLFNQLSLGIIFYNSGTIDPSNKAAYTDYIDLSNIDMVSLKIVEENFKYSVTFYDVNKNFVSGDNYVRQDQTFPHSANDTVKYMRLTISQDDVSSQTSGNYFANGVAIILHKPIKDLYEYINSNIGTYAFGKENFINNSGSYGTKVNRLVIISAPITGINGKISFNYWGTKIKSNVHLLLFEWQGASSFKLIDEDIVNFGSGTDVTIDTKFEVYKDKIYYCGFYGVANDPTGITYDTSDHSVPYYMTSEIEGYEIGTVYNNFTIYSNASFNVKILVKGPKYQGYDNYRKYRWENKKMVCLGDSLTYGDTGAGYRSTNPWPSLMKNLSQLSSCVNYGSNGTTLAGSSASSFCSRYESMDDDANLICVFGGVNDFAYNVSLGAMGDTTRSTFYGGLDFLIKGLREKYGMDATIFFITPPKTYKDEPSSYNFIRPNGANKYEYEYANAIKEVCSYYSIPVFDLYEKGCNLDAVLDTEGVIRPDKLHFSNLGYEKLAHSIAAFIKKLLIIN